MLQDSRVRCPPEKWRRTLVLITRERQWAVSLSFPHLPISQRRVGALLVCLRLIDFCVVQHFLITDSL